VSAALEQHIGRPVSPFASDSLGLKLVYESQSSSSPFSRNDITGGAMASSIHLPVLQLFDAPAAAPMHKEQAHLIAHPAHHPNFFEEVGNVAVEFGKGAVNELIHNPLHVVEVAAEGLAAGVVIGAVGTAAIAAGIVSAPVLAVGGVVVGAGLLAAQIAPHAGEIAHNIGTVADPTAHTAAELAQAKLAVESYGGVTLDAAAGFAAGMAGGALGSKLATMAIESSTATTAAAATESAEASNIRPADLSTPEVNTSEPELRLAMRNAIAQAKTDGTPLNIKVDTTVAMTDASGAPIKLNQAELLYQELQAAHPENHFTFSKPDLNPGDAGYKEFAAPEISQDGLRISTKENAITLGRETALPNGTTLPEGTKFAVGTTHDGAFVRSASPDSTVWAIKPDGQFVEVAPAGQAAPLPVEAISADPLKGGQIADTRTADGFPNRIIVRADSALDPKNVPLLDAYPNGGASFEEAYKPGSRPGMFAPKPKSAAHFRLFPNQTVEAQTSWGPASASGANVFARRRGTRSNE